MLVEVFENIQQNKVNYAVSRNGDQFEQWFKSFVKSRGFAEIFQITKTNSNCKGIIFYFSV